jgi:hypothetical protein
MPARRRRAAKPQIVGDPQPSDDLDILPRTTKWYRDHGRCTRRAKAAKEQYLTPNEEKALAAYVLRMSKYGFPLPVKVLRSLAPVIRQRRIRGTSAAGVVQPPGKNWPQGFYKRNLELVARRVKAMPWNRHDHTIYLKTVDWFSIIGEEFANPALYCIPSLRRTLPSGIRLWYFHFARPSHPQHNWAVEERTRIASRRPPAIECTALELILSHLVLLVGKGSVKVGIVVIHRIVLQTMLLMRKCSICPKAQFATLHRPLPITCSQPLSLHACGDHICRDGGAYGRYFESADRDAGLTQAPIFGACSSARLAALRYELERSTS